MAAYSLTAGAPLSRVKAGTRQSECWGNETIPHEGRHVVPGPCQPKETVLPLRDTKHRCPCLFFTSSKAVKSPKLTLEITKAPRRLSRRQQSFHLWNSSQNQPERHSYKIRAVKHLFHLDYNLKEK